MVFSRYHISFDTWVSNFSSVSLTTCIPNITCSSAFICLVCFTGHIYLTHFSNYEISTFILCFACLTCWSACFGFALSKIFHWVCVSLVPASPVVVRLPCRVVLYWVVLCSFSCRASSSLPVFLSFSSCALFIASIFLLTWCCVCCVHVFSFAPFLLAGCNYVCLPFFCLELWFM